MALVLLGSSAELSAPLGGKARALAELRRSGIAIPPWCVVLPEAFMAGLSPSQRTAFERGEGQELSEIVVAPSREVGCELDHALAQLCPDGELLAVRSSAADEDGAEHSFAGQFESYLSVPPDRAAEFITKVWISGFSNRILSYRHSHHLVGVPRPPAVLIQRMVRAEASGVAFGADPVSGRRGVAVVSAVWGLGTSLVSGECDADTWRVDRNGQILTREIANKRMKHVLDRDSAGGVRAEPVSSDAALGPVLEDTQVRCVAELVRGSGKFFGRPQDIEWAYAGGTLFLLQSRPITSLATMPDPDGERNLWDNSNIAESYDGITTPLTFSFVRHVYEEVYRQFCHLMSVPADTIARHEDVFPRMLGLIRGRVYYNLLNWYRLLALLPGFRMNRKFMEQMMGVKEGLPESVAADLAGAAWTARLSDALSLIRSLLVLVGRHWSMQRTIERFYARLDEALGRSRPDLDLLRPDELAGLYRELERKLLLHWDAPLINDFLAMIFHGLLRKFTDRWCSEEGETLSNDLLCGEGGMISAEPAARVRTLAGLAREDPGLPAILCQGSGDEIDAAIAASPRFRAEYLAYLDKFGDRCLGELKLESPTLFDNPTPLFRCVGQLAGRATPATPVDEAQIRLRAEQKQASALRGHLLRKFIFGWVLKNARHRVRDRENLRFERTRLYGRVRAIFVEIGRKLHALGLLDAPRDVFFLEVDEVLGFIAGTTSTTDLKGLTALRKAEFERFGLDEPPGERFETVGIVNHNNRYKSESTADVVEGEVRRGLGCCPGVVCGRVRIVTDPSAGVLRHGEILVAERTDPGWIMIFPSAAGLLVEWGSLLSHSAIVAREMGIPAVVSLPGLTRWLSDGDWVELDGGLGVVTRLADPATEASHGE